MFSLFGLLAFVGSANALTIQPSVIDDISLNPGESATKSVKLTNDSDEALTITPTLYDAEASSGTSGGINFVPSNPSSTLANWISFNASNNQIVLQPRETRELPIYITIPEVASAGGHFAMIAWRGGVPADANKATGATILSAVATNIAVDVKGKVLESGEIVSFSTKGNITNYDKLPVDFETVVHNSGTRHFKPRGFVHVKNMFGKNVADLPINQTDVAGGNVLPNGTQTYPATWNGEFAFGKYTAVLDLTLGGAGQKMATYELWVMPAGLLVLWLIIALVIIAILILLIKRALQSSSNLKK